MYTIKPVAAGTIKNAANVFAVFLIYYWIDWRFDIPGPHFQLYVTWLIHNTFQPFTLFVTALLVFVIAGMLVSLIRLNKFKGYQSILLSAVWILMTTVPGYLFVRDAYYNSWETWFSWNFLVWEVGLPIFIGMGQLLMLLVFLGMHLVSRRARKP